MVNLFVNHFRSRTLSFRYEAEKERMNADPTLVYDMKAEMEAYCGKKNFCVNGCMKK